MKKLLSTLLLIAIVITQATAAIANLQVSSAPNSPMKIVLDGQIVSQGSNQVTIEGIPEGSHFIQINHLVYGPNSLSEVIAYQGEIYLPGNTLMVTSLQNNQLVINRVEPLFLPPQTVVYDNVQPPVYEHKPEYFTPPPHQGQNYYNPPPPEVVSCQTAPPAQVYVPDYQPPVYAGMDPATFQQLKATIDSKWFSSGKMGVVEMALSQNYFTAQQVAELTNLFTYENDRVKIAKIAYTQTVDPQNYFLVYEQMNYNSSANALSAYIASL